MKHPFAGRAGTLPGLLLAGLLAGPSPAQAAQVPVIQTIPATTHAVQALRRGSLVDIFFTAGERVKRGQILAKLERSDGSPDYLLAPVAGRISPPHQHLGETLGAHSVLAEIETAPPAAAQPTN